MLKDYKELNWKTYAIFLLMFFLIVDNYYTKMCPS